MVVEFPLDPRILRIHVFLPLSGADILGQVREVNAREQPSQIDFMVTALA